MTNTPNTTQMMAVAINSVEGEAPDWVQLLPAGPKVAGRDGRNWTLSNPEAVVAAFNRYGADLPVDYEHATQIKGEKGEAALAVGWIKGLEARNGAIWGRVEWSNEGRAAVASKGYRYLSPVFNFAKSTGEISTMVSAGLTNQPNLQMAALNKQTGQEEASMDKDVLAALGLADGATSADAVQAINKLKTDEATARNRADTPDPTKFVPRADFELAQNRVKTFEDAEKAREVEAITAAVEAAVEAGKIAPASRDYHIAACKQEGGLDRFRAMVSASPELAGKSGLDGKAPVQRDAAKLTSEEIAACRMLGLPEETFKPTAKEG